MSLVWGVGMGLIGFAMKVFDVYSQWAWKRRSERKWGVWDGGEGFYEDLTKRVWIRLRGRGDLCSKMGIEREQQIRKNGNRERERERACM